MNQPILDIHNNAKDQNIGQTLLRLASLAQAVHAFESTQQLNEDLKRDSNPRINGLKRNAHIDDGVAPSNTVRTEVNQ